MTILQTPHDAQTAPARVWLDVLPKLRDSVLVIFGTAYALGYIVWAIHAYRNGLGGRPASPAQYFVAGAPVLTVLVILLCLFYWLPQALKSLRDFAIRRFGRRGHALIGLVGILILVAAYRLDALSTKSLAGTVVTGMVVLLLALTGITLMVGDFPVRAFLVTIVPLCMLAIHAYAYSIFPNLPQEFGGGRPRCVTVSIGELAVTPAWKVLVVQSKQAAAFNMRHRPDSSKLLKSIAASTERDVTRMEMGEAAINEYATTGPLMLWAESESELLVSVGSFDARLDDRFVVPRTDSMIVTYISSIAASGNGCPEEK
jgi:hypothetical protein